MCAYGVAWNESAPVGSTTDASTIDTEIQNLKVSIRERMNNILHSTGDWGTDSEEPKLVDIAALAGTPVVALVYASGALTLADSTALILLWNSETLDTATLHSTSTDTGRFTIITAGYYRLVASIQVEAGSAAADIALRLRKNGVNIRIVNTPVIASDNTTLYINEVVLAAAADYYDLQMHQTSGQAMNIGYGANGSMFSIEKLNGTT